jgi:hypothetical protein
MAQFTMGSFARWSSSMRQSVASQTRGYASKSGKIPAHALNYLICKMLTTIYFYSNPKLLTDLLSRTGPAPLPIPSRPIHPIWTPEPATPKHVQGEAQAATRG